MAEASLVQTKYERLKSTIRELGPMAIAYSGGVDSTLLLKAAHEALDGDVLAITAASPLVPQREIAESRTVCEENGIEQIVVSAGSLESEAFAHNPHDRCYLCKTDIMSTLLETAAQHGYTLLAEGSNLDDRNDYRPGSRAVEELGLASPLLAAGLTKEEVRDISEMLGLPTWNKPSLACLATRFPYGSAITAEKLKAVGAAEEWLRGKGFGQLRVRCHGDEDLLARIEVAPADFGRFCDAEFAHEVEQALRGLGFSYVSLDLGGYTSGSMNRTLDNA